MTTREDIINWLNDQPEGTLVWIDEGGLALECDTGAYNEIGGKPLDDEEETP